MTNNEGLVGAEEIGTAGVRTGHPPVSQKEGVDRKELGEKIRSVVKSDFGSDLTIDEKEGVTKLLSTANELRQKHSSGQYIDEKMAGAIISVCRKFKGSGVRKPSLCNKPLDWADKTWEEFFGLD